MANLECVRVYTRTSASATTNTLVYDKATGTGTDEGKFGYMYTQIESTGVYTRQFYLRVYKFTAPGRSNKYSISIPATLSEYTPSSIRTTSCQFYVQASNNIDDFANYYWDSYPSGWGDDFYSIPSQGLKGEVTVTANAGTAYIGIWMSGRNFTADKGAIWTGLNGATINFTNVSTDSVSCTSSPTEGQSFYVYASTNEGLSWYYTVNDGASTVYTSSTFSGSTSTAVTIPSSWFVNLPSGQTSMSMTVYVYTMYSGSSYLAGSVTKTFYSGQAFAPTIAAGAFSSVVPVNTGTLNDYFATVSQVRATIDTSYITCYSSTLSSVSCSFEGTAMSASGDVFTSGKIPNAGTNTLTLTATDSAGRSSTRDYTITVQSYTRPSLTNVGVYRCDSSGTASKTGTYFRATATQQYMSATAGGVSNAGVTHVYLSANGSTYTELANLPSATETEYSGLTATNTYSVRLVITDSIGGSSDGVVIDLSYEEWMFCCTSDGGGAAIGMGANTDNALEIPGDWVLKSASGGQSAEFGASIMKLVSGAHYGTAAPSGTGENGEVYFKLSSSGTGWISATPYIYISSS